MATAQEIIGFLNETQFDPAVFKAVHEAEKFIEDHADNNPATIGNMLRGNALQEKPDEQAV